MRSLQIALGALSLVALGCRTDPNQVLLEQESRMLEDKVYELQACLDDCHAAREATIRENESLKKELAGGDRGAGSDLGGPSLSSPAEGRDAPLRSRRGEAPKLEVPTIELPEPSDTPPLEMTPGGGESTAVEGVPTELVINSRLTGGMDRDGHGGDEGVMVVFAPRDAEGRPVKSPGAVSIVVMDPALEGDESRVARWDFAADEVTNHFRKTVFGPGLQFELPWPAQPPRHRDLRLFVRYTTPEGTKINADTAIDVRSPSDPPRWSASESAGRPPRKRASNSRVKSRSASTAPPYRRADDDSAHDETADGDPSVRQARQPSRPDWKPYR